MKIRDQNFTLYNLSSFRVKQEDRVFKKKMKTTGGGPPPTPPKQKEEHSLAASMMEVDLAMGNEVYETFALEPSDGRTSPTLLYVLDKESKFCIDFFLFL